MSITTELEGEVNKLARSTMFNVLRGLVLGTPVDTGRARGNWQVSISNPINSQSDDLDKSGQPTINKGLAAMAKAKAIKYPVLWLTNNLPYIEALNDGHSEKAPAKFVEAVIKIVENK